MRILGRAWGKIDNFLWLLMVRFRTLISPILYWIGRKTVYRGKLPDVWSEVNELPMEEFSGKINSYRYLPDWWSGLWDNTLQESDFFFLEDRNYNRDCDDFAQMWYWWALNNGYEACLIVLSNGWRMGHKTCIFVKDGRYYLADYVIVDHYDSIGQAMFAFVKYFGYDAAKLRYFITKASHGSLTDDKVKFL